MKFQIYDTVNKYYVKGEYSTGKRARNKAEKLNMEYGANR